MKKSFLTLAAIALVLSFTSCKDESAEQTEVEVIEEVEAPVEVIETPSEEVMDSTDVETMEVEENVTETAVN
jgi:PBP1b-binding outer membrane lipoprotein LpoB